MEGAGVAEEQERDKRSYKNCCSAGCLNTTFNCELTFFSLPSDKVRRNIWLKLIKREDLDDVPSTHYRVCEDHFDADCIVLSRTRKLLKKNASPSRCLPQTVQEECSQCKACPRHPVSPSPQTSSCQPNDNRTDSLIIDPNESNRFFMLCDKFLNDNLAQIVKEQVEYRCKYKYTEEYKILCLNLFYANPEAYGMLSETLYLPNKSCLMNMCLPIMKKTSYMMDLLRAKVAEIKDSEIFFSLVIDATSLKPNLVYDDKEDLIFGFHEVNELQSPEPAEYGLIAYVRELFGSFEQPVAYALLPATNNEAHVSRWIDSLVRKLSAAGIRVRVLITRSSYDFLNSAKRSHVSREQPYFFVDDQKVYYMFDPSYLLIHLRNNLMQYDFHFENVVAKWDDINQVYEKDADRQLKIAPKLTESHVCPAEDAREQPQLAAQVFSAPVAAALSFYKDFEVLDQSVEGTILLIKKLNDLIKFFNLSSRYDCPSYRHDNFDNIVYTTYFIDLMLKFFANLTLIDEKNGIDVTSLVTFIEAFQITLKSTLHLYENLKMDSKTYILNKKSFREFIEKMVLYAEPITKTKPTGWELVSVFRKSYLKVLFKAPIKNGDLTKDSLFALDDGPNSSGAVKRRQTHTPTITTSATTTAKKQKSMDYSSTEYQIKSENTMDFEDGSPPSTFNQEGDVESSERNNQDNVLLQIKQEEADFLNMPFEVEENELIISSLGQEHNYGYPFIKQEPDDIMTNDVNSVQDRKPELSDATQQQICTPEKESILDKEGNGGKHQSKDEEEDKPESDITVTTEGSLKRDDILKMIFAIKSVEREKDTIKASYYKTLYLPEKNALMYLCGRLLEKCCTVRHKTCQGCKSYINVGKKEDADKDRFSRYINYLKDGGKNMYAVPPDEFVKFIEILDRVFCAYFKEQHVKPPILKTLLTRVKNVYFSMPCNHFPLEYMKRLFFRSRIFLTLNYNNRMYNECQAQRKFIIPNL